MKALRKATAMRIPPRYVFGKLSYGSIRSTPIAVTTKAENTNLEVDAEKDVLEDTGDDLDSFLGQPMHHRPR